MLYNDVESVEERHRHRWEVNPDLVSKFEEKGFKFVGQDEDAQRMEIFELESKLAMAGLEVNHRHIFLRWWIRFPLMVMCRYVQQTYNLSLLTWQ